jgi:LuxR family maltose regulon positive regulatory protein
MQEYDYYIGITGVYLKRMELDKAFENLEAARAMVTSSAMPHNMILYSFDYNLAEYHMLRGETEEGAKLILRIIKSNNVIHWADRLMAELNLSGYMQPELKEQILAEFETYPNKSISPSLSFELLCARLYLQSGNREKAKAIIKGVLSFSRENGNSLRLVEADLLLLHMIDSSTPAGRRQQNNLLREAIYYAWENRILQPFYVDRDAVNPLWDNFNAELSDKISEPERIFVRDAIRVCSNDAPKAGKSLLSSRETEVLIELAQGKTNQQIAEDLCISLSTVKTHLISIYGKLGVSSRLAATSEGKRLGLIS